MKTKTLSILLLAAILIPGYSFAEEWQDITRNLSDKGFYAIAGSRYGSAVYVGTKNGLYRKTGDEGGWRQIFSSRGEPKGVSDIYINGENAIYMATKKGLYKSGDLGKTWKSIFTGIGRQNYTTFVTRDKKNEKMLYLGTEKGLFRTEDEGETWQKFFGIFGNSKINSIASGEKGIFVICNNNVYRIARDFENYKKIFSSDSPESFEEDARIEESPSEDGIFFSLNDITLEGSSLYLSTNRGLFISKDMGDSWAPFDATGLSNRCVNGTLVARNGSEIFAATKGGVFKYRESEHKWENIYEGMSSAEVRELAITRPGDYIWALSDARVYRMKLDNFKGPAAQASSDTDEIFLRFANEPNVNEVQAMAIAYAEVYPEKIEKWRRGARYKALLPKITFGIDKDRSDELHWDSGTKPDTLIIGPEDEKTGWDLTCSWDIGDLIYNEHQTSIDVRSKLMVQLRDDIVDQVTRIYFERRRLQIETAMAPPQNLQNRLKSELRIQELTAGLDGLTGGRFSQAI